ncbi:MAG TPA: hypothetical protein VMT57_03985 [Candidatus Thermoplasmatota archaeon]|nr:hypothetical protein [Candidatus Thermoplasmatota archaeon]
MNKYPVIGGSICAVVLLVLASLTNVVGYQTVQASNQKMVTSEVNPKELLFQTIVDVANNKDIQRVILGSEIIGKRFFDSSMRFSVFTPPVLTEKFLKRMYTMGVILSKTISKSKMHSLLEQYPVSNQGLQKGINAVIEKDVTLKEEMTQLSNLNCHCCASNSFPNVFCGVLAGLFYIAYVIGWSIPMISISIIALFIAVVCVIIAFILQCSWLSGGG